MQESGRWRESAARHSLATIFVAAPRTTDERLRELTTAGTGFVYASSLMGVTGVREGVSTAASLLVRRIRAATELPVCVGIGISNAAQAAQVAGFADGVIVASALVRAILDAPDAAMGAEAVAELTAELSRATRRHADQAGLGSPGHDALPGPAVLAPLVLDVAREPASQVPSPRRTVDDTAASPGLAGRSSVVMPMSWFMAASWYS